MCTAPINADEVRKDMKRLRFRQVDLMVMLHERGIEASPSTLSTALSGRGFAPRFQRILKAIQEIIEEEEKK